MSKYLNYAKEISEALYREHQIDYRFVLDTEPDYQLTAPVFNFEHLNTQYLWVNTAKLTVFHTIIILDTGTLRKQGAYSPEAAYKASIDSLHKPNQTLALKVIDHRVPQKTHMDLACARHFIGAYLSLPHTISSTPYKLINQKLFNPGSSNSYKVKARQFFNVNKSWPEFKKEINSDFANVNNYYKINLSDHTM